MRPNVRHQLQLPAIILKRANSMAHSKANTDLVVKEEKRRQSDLPGNSSIVVPLARTLCTLSTRHFSFLPGIHDVSLRTFVNLAN